MPYKAKNLNTVNTITLPMHKEENENITIINNDTDTDESKDFSQDVNKDEFSVKNIDFEELRENLNNNVYNDEKLTANAINHIRKNINSQTEIQCETKGMKNKISVRTKGDADRVAMSGYLVSKAEKGEKTLQIIHNHPSGTPLPHSEDIHNIIRYKIENSGIVGNYGYLNIKNSFKELSEGDISKIKTKADNLFDELKKKAFKYNPFIKYESDKVRNAVKYKYNKENINSIVEEYENEFKQYGIEFKYTPYKLKKR